MEGEIKQYSKGNIREPVQSKRLIQDLSREGKIPLYGNRGIELKKIITETEESVLPLMEMKHKAWITKKTNSLKKYLGKYSDPALLEEIYMHGLRNAVTQAYRVNKSISITGDKEVEYDSDHLQNIITGFTFDFYRTLTVAKRLEISPASAVKIAQNAYHFSPDTLIKLGKDYPQFPQNVLNRALISFPLNYDEHLESTERIIEDLTPLFPDIPAYAILRIADKLTLDPKKGLSEYRQRVKDLSSKFPNMLPKIIHDALASYPEQAELRLAQANELYPKLKEKYQGRLPASFVLSIILRDPKNAINNIDKAEVDSRQLRLLYPSLPPYVITEAIRRSAREKTQRKYLNNIQKTTDEMSEIFKLDRSTIIHVVKRTNNPKEYLEKVRNIIQTLTEQFDNSQDEGLRQFPRSGIEKIASRFPNFETTNSYIKQIIKNANDWSDRYSLTWPTLIHLLTNRPNLSEDQLKELLAKREKKEISTDLEEENLD